MANEAGKNERRESITFWDGTNAIVSKSIAKKQELIHTENVRSETIGTIEKRAGQVVLGTDTSGGRFKARDNYDLAQVSTGFSSVNGFYRLSGSGEPYTTFTISVYDDLYVTDANTWSLATNIWTYVKVSDYVTLTEVPFSGVNDTATKYISNTDYSDVNIYKLSEATSKWNKIADSDANNIPAADFTHTTMEFATLETFISNNQ